MDGQLIRHRLFLDTFSSSYFVLNTLPLFRQWLFGWKATDKRINNDGIEESTNNSMVLIQFTERIISSRFTWSCLCAHFSGAQHQSIFPFYFDSDVEFYKIIWVLAFFYFIECKSIEILQSVRFTRAMDKSTKNIVSIFFKAKNMAASEKIHMDSVQH